MGEEAGTLWAAASSSLVTAQEWGIPAKTSGLEAPLTLDQPRIQQGAALNYRHRGRWAGIADGLVPCDGDGLIP